MASAYQQKWLDPHDAFSSPWMWQFCFH
jgi:hypothetical protein